MLALFRYEMTDNFRPTRSTFWHSFMAGVVVSNPYGLVNDDQSVWQFAQRIDPSLSGYRLSEMYLLPDSPYQQRLKGVAKEFVTQHPGLFLRNFAYRAAIILLPTLYRDGDLRLKACWQSFTPSDSCCCLYGCSGCVICAGTCRWSSL